MFGFKRKKPKRAPRSSGGNSKAAKEAAELKTRLELAEHQNQLKDAENQSLRERIEILEETIQVLRDCLGAQQVTSNLHSAEGKILLSEYQQQGPPANGRAPLHR